jgi:hypothetical protein
MTAAATMKPLLRIAAAAGLALALTLLAAPQGPPQGPPQARPPRQPPNPSSEGDVTLPNGKSQQEEILKADHEKDLKDVAQLVELA